MRTRMSYEGYEDLGSSEDEDVKGFSGRKAQCQPDGICREQTVPSLHYRAALIE